MRVLVTSDTHVGAARRQLLPAALLAGAEGADAILHGGDLTDPEILLELGAYAPVARGTRELRSARSRACPSGGSSSSPARRSGWCTTLDPSRDAASGCGRGFPAAAWSSSATRTCPFATTGDGLLLLNPGSPTERRRAPFRSFAELDLADDGVVVAHIVAL